MAADWAGGDATLYFSGPANVRFGIHGMVVGDSINVVGVTPSGYNGQQTVTAVTGYSVSYTVGDPGAFSSGGTVEWVGSVKAIQDITVSGPPAPTAFNITAAYCTKNGGDRFGTITAAGHTYAGGESVIISGVTPAGWNATWTVRAVAGDDFEFDLSADPGTGTAFGEVVEDASGGTYTLVVTLNSGNNSAEILNLNPASGTPKDGDIVRIYGATPSEYNERWEVDAGGVDTASNPPTITLRCPPKMRVAEGLPACDPVSFEAYVSGGILQSTSTLRETVFDSRGSDHLDTANFLGHDEHSFATQDMPSQSQDGYLYGPCELCHTSPDISKHQTTEYSTTHNNGRTRTTECHFHVMGFDKANISCDRTPCFTP